MVFAMFGFAAMLESAFDWIELKLIEHHQVVESKTRKRARRRLLKQQTVNHSIVMHARKT
jgi:hypothetical protein